MTYITLSVLRRINLADLESNRNVLKFEYLPVGCHKQRGREWIMSPSSYLLHLAGTSLDDST
jgi:hypothetical protein